MLILISPAKTLDYGVQIPDGLQTTDIAFPKETQDLAAGLKKLSSKQIQDLMSVSPKLAQLNFERYQQFSYPFKKEEVKPALLVFKGEVFVGINAANFSVEDLHYAQDHLRILSGLYGVLRPLDNIFPYRLEMGTKYGIGKFKHLYDFWGMKINKAVQDALNAQGDKVLINLASNEYYKAVKANKLDAKVITPQFKDFKNGQYKMISFFAKKARGLMTNFILKNRIQNPEEIKLFDLEGYNYNDRLSEGNNWVFTRG
jgi:cytoplasmic iron level regulating protein YaaA (DUF328/UPF0246 family)